MTNSGGITRSSSSGNYTYNTIAGRENWPVVFVDFYDALRFASWLHNGQPSGAQDNTTTEDGAYTITAAGIADNSISRNAGATIFVTSEDEWYKVAYYDAPPELRRVAPPCHIVPLHDYGSGVQIYPSRKPRAAQILQSPQYVSARFLLGRALIEDGQIETGRNVLREFLAESSPTNAHRSAAANLLR